MFIFEFCPILIIEKIVYEYLKNTMIKARLGWQPPSRQQ